MNVGIDENTILDWMRFQLEIFLSILELLFSILINFF